MICMVSVAPIVSICFALRMSTGTAFSASAPRARDPTVTSSANESVIATSWVIAPAVSLRRDLPGDDGGLLRTNASRREDERHDGHKYQTDASVHSTSLLQDSSI